MSFASYLPVFASTVEPSMLTVGLYDPFLVVLSVLIAIFSSWMGLQVAGHAHGASTATLRNVALLTGSLALGSGVWAMHFIGMLAFDLCTPVEYEHTITILSMLPSVAASWVALSLIGRPQIGKWTLLAGGVLVGAGIGTMHYTGMAAMQSALTLRYDPWMFGLSIVVAVVLATLALWVRFGLSSLRIRRRSILLGSAAVMGSAIAGMHYTGMAAARFVGQVAPGQAGGGASVTFVALAVSLITIVFTVLVMGANGMLRYRALFLQLSQSEAWMRALHATAADGVITVSADGHIQEFNAAAERIFGWSQEEISGKHIRLLMDNTARSEQEGFLHYLNHRGQRSAGVSGESSGLRKDGSVVPVRAAYGHARMGGQERFVCFITDLTERRKLETAMRKSEQQFRSLIANIPGISYRALNSPTWPMVFISEAVERLTGYPAADFIGETPAQRFCQLIHPQDRDRVMQSISEAVQEGRAFEVEYRLQNRAGFYLWMWEHGSAERDELGVVQWRDGVILEITERRRMEDDLREAKEIAEQAADARAAFVANMSHEIRTPMNSILGFTDVLLEGRLEDEARRHLGTVRSAARSLLRLLNEVLDTAKLDKGAMELELSDFNLLALLDELSSTIGAAARSKGLVLQIHYDSSLPLYFHGDEMRIRQVLTNLLGNAIKFTESGSVLLSVEPREGQVHFKVMDTGIGIPEDRLEQIFDAFTQADASMSRRFGGTGLGTTISKQLTELMNGRIWAESSPGLGSIFHVLLPLENAHRTPDQRHAENAIALPTLTILVADDVPQNIELLRLLLGRQGHTVLSASDGAIAVELAAQKNPDLILMDVQMPGMNGLDATRRIRAAEAQHGGRRVPVIAMTASVMDADRRAAREAGMDGFASKPVDLPALHLQIAVVLGLVAGISEVPEVAAPAPQAMLLDRERALQRWGNERVAYHRALRRFIADHSGVAVTLATQATSDVDAARAQAHKVIGVAVTLGLDQLAGMLRRLEAAFVARDTDAEVAILAELPETMAATLEEIGLELKPAGAPPAARPSAVPVNEAATAAAPLDAQQLHELGARLQDAFRRGSLDDQALLQLVAALRGHGQSARFQELQLALDEFDFSTAEAKLKLILAAGASVAASAAAEGVK